MFAQKIMEELWVATTKVDEFVFCRNLGRAPQVFMFVSSTAPTDLPRYSAQ